MDRDQFDRLSRLVATAGTRRGALRLLVAGALAGAAGGVGSAAARKRGRRGRTRGRVRAEQSELCTTRCVSCATKPIRPGANLAKCDFDDESFLDGLDLSSANVSGACFVRAELRAARFSGANAGGACFVSADLTGASFRGANVRKAVFCGADLSGADFRGSNVTTAQLACALVACDTILPNGTPAVTCEPGETCCGGACLDTDDNPGNCGACGNDCGPCQACANGQCVAVPNRSFACDGSTLRPAGDARCTTTEQTGVCLDGACACGQAAVYDPRANVCRCNQRETQLCGNNQPPLQCCEISEVCIGLQGGIAELIRCIDCG